MEYFEYIFCLGLKLNKLSCCLVQSEQFFFKSIFKSAFCHILEKKNKNEEKLISETTVLANYFWQSVWIGKDKLFSW